MDSSLGRSQQDYLKTILMVKKEYGACRVMDVAKKMNVSMSSASIAIKKLEKDGYLIKDDWRVLLTEEGDIIAQGLYEKDVFFYELFKKIGISNETAKKDACKVEHALSEESFKKIKEFFDCCLSK